MQRPHSLSKDYSFAAIVFLGLVAVCLIFFVFAACRYIFSYHLQHAEEREKAAQNYRHEAIVGVVKCLGTIPENRFLDRLSCLSEKIQTAEDASATYYDLKSQQDMAEWALATLIVALVGLIASIIGVFLVWRTLKATAVSTEILGEDFIAAHPPKILVFQAHLEFDGIFRCTKSTRLGGVYLVNAGGSDARISGGFLAKPPQYGNIVLHVGTHAPAFKPFDVSQKANWLEKDELKAGGSYWWDISDVSMVDRDRLQDAYTGASSDQIYIIGRIHFSDTRGAARQTVFCRVYDRDQRCFVSSGSPDFEYQA